MSISPKTHCFFCRQDMRKFHKDRIHTCYDIMEVYELRISDLEKENKKLKETAKFFRGELERGRKNEAQF